MFFWEQVEYIREIKNISRKELSLKADFSLSSISTGLARNSYPSAEVAVKIAQALGVSVEYLVTGKETSKDSLLTPDTKKIISLLAKFTPQEKEAFLVLLETLANRI